MNLYFTIMGGKVTKIRGLAGYLAIGLCLGGTTLLAQEQEETYEYSQEYIWGISKNTNSGLIAGLAGKYNRKISDGQFQSFGLEIVNVKNPKELRRVSRASGNTFILNKTNYLFSVRPQYGREWVVFRKAPQQGVQVNFVLAGGPTLGLLMPYYVQEGQSPNVSIKPAREVDQVTRVQGSGPFLRGFREGEVDVKIGANIKAALSFEFGTFKNDVTGFEAGFQLEGFSEAIEIAQVAGTQQFFPSAFIMLFYGSRR